MTDGLLDAPVLPFLMPDEPPAVEVINAGGQGSAVLFCDHACNRIPRRLGALGLDAAQLADHIAWDPGAANVARRLSAALDAPLVLTGYSRLVIDCNRPLSSPESIPEQSADIAVPGNRGLSSEEKEHRAGALFWPYHRAIEQLLDDRSQRPSLLLSVHSFTPVFQGQHRPWHIGVSCRKDRAFAALMLDALARSGDLCVGDNLPYPIEDAFDYTLPKHAEVRGLPGVMIEIRQDGLRTEADAKLWVTRLWEAYEAIEAEALGL